MSVDRLTSIEARANEALEAMRFDSLGIGYEHMGDMWRDMEPLCRDVLALVEIAKAARGRTHAGHGPNCSWPYSDERHQYPCDCGHIPLVDALARLDSGATEGDA